MINQNRLVSTFIELVKIDSPSGYEKDISRFVSTKIKSLGGHIQRDSYGNLIAKFKGIGEPFMINSHLDTVEPGQGIKPKVEGNRIVSDGTTILGADAKAGVAVILEALASLKENRANHLPIEAVFTLDEEIGLLGAKNLDYGLIKSKRGITFDGDKSGVENVTTSAPGYDTVDVSIIGRSAHAGSEPEKGISAIKIASEIISKLKLGRIDDETTANVGLIDGGSARNTVPEEAHFKAEIRSRDLKKLVNYSSQFERVFKEVLRNFPNAKIDFDITREFNPYVFSETHHVIQQINKALNKIGLKPKYAAAGGSSDVNIFYSRQGIDIVCVGGMYLDPHTTRERVEIQDLVNGARFCEKLVSN